MMDAGQITQGLRADILQQAAGQGMNVMQMMESGMSFADIMLMIVQNQQSVADIPVMQTQQDVAGVPNMEEALEILNFQTNAVNPDIVLNIQNSDIASDFSGLMKDVSDMNDEGVISEADMLINNTENLVINNTDNMDVFQLFVKNDNQDTYNDNFFVKKDNQNNPDMNPDIKDPVQTQTNIWTDNPMAEKLTEILNITGNAVLGKENNENGNNFVVKLLSELSDSNQVKDSFDFSESMLKVDPLQLAGLLDFISTGNGIPLASDISDNQMFRNLENTASVKGVSDGLIFNPEEMLANGEMEIVSYVPAGNKASDSFTQQQQPQTDGETIDFARTMKSVRENVKTDITDEQEAVSEFSSVMNGVNPDELAQKVDISFERAYAELEMNKAKYGSADQQLYKGISENLQDGKSEFTVKLRPEGLGEILVKLVTDEGGKSVLSLVASSEKTAELLNRDLASLQTSLNNHNVEIENNSVKTAETVMHAQSAFDQFDERRQDEANQQNHFRQLKNKLGEISDRNVSFDAETEPIISSVADSALNITI